MPLQKEPKHKAYGIKTTAPRKDIEVLIVLMIF
jgi:hypothetical protein